MRPSRALGQNFVTDANTVRRIARLANVGAGDRVVEIGPGVGSLTLALLETGAAVTAVELDRHLLPVLEETVVPAGREFFTQTRSVSTGPRCSATEPGWVLVANLPYNVATPLVLQVLASAPMVQRLLVMVQREVGERLAAGPGSKIYGAVSVKVAWFGEARVVGLVPPTVFIAATEGRVGARRDRASRRAAGRRGTGRLGAALRAGRCRLRDTAQDAAQQPGRADGPEAFAAAGVAPTERAEQLDLAAWAKLASWSSPRPS